MMLDDTLQESIGTHFPLTWRDTLQNFDNTEAFFRVAHTPGLTEDIYILTLQSLCELASCRISIFESLAKRKDYVHRFARNLSQLMKVQSEHFCSSRAISRHYIRLFYKFQMNFQTRSFGIKEQEGMESLKMYLNDLSEFTNLVIKSGQNYLREIAIHLLATWNRINLEIKEDADIKMKTEEIIVNLIEQNISDLTDDHEDDDDEQFNQKELGNLNQRFDIIARTCNVHIATAFNCLNEGLEFLMRKYEEVLQSNDGDLLELLEKRFSWTIRVICSMMNLGFSPKNPNPDSSDPQPTGPNECDACIKIIDIIRLNVHLNVEQRRKMSEPFELATLSFISSFRTIILIDSRVVAKCINEDEEDQTGIHRGSGYLRI